MDSKNHNPRRTRESVWRGMSFAPFLAVLFAVQLSAGVLVAPTSLILSDHKKTGRLTVQNPSDKPKEVSIDFYVGMPVSDSLGNVTILLQDSAITDPRSAADWIKAFPRKVVLAPNASQVVRFVAHPPKDLEDGEYWARVVVRSQEGETSIPAASDNEKITTKLNMIMQTAISLKYRTGNLLSKLEVASAGAAMTDTTVNVLIDMVNRGNVSYIGVLQCRLIDADGKVISRDQIDLAVYRELIRNMKLPVVNGDFKKPFSAEISITNEGRTDIPVEDMVVGNSIVMTEPVQ